MSVTLATVATEFLGHSELAPATFRSYELTLLPLLKKYGSWPLSLLTRQQLQEYLAGLTHLSYTTHNRHQAIVQALLNFAVAEGYLPANPLVGLKRRKADRTLGEKDSDDIIRYLSPEQVQTLLSTVRPYPRLHTLVRLLHRTGHGWQRFYP